MMVDGEPCVVIDQMCGCESPAFMARGAKCVQIGSPPTSYAKATPWVCQGCGTKVLVVDEEYVDPPPPSLFGGSE